MWSYAMTSLLYSTMQSPTSRLIRILHQKHGSVSTLSFIRTHLVMPHNAAGTTMYMRHSNRNQSHRDNKAPRRMKSATTGTRKVGARSKKWLDTSADDAMSASHAMTLVTKSIAAQRLPLRPVLDSGVLLLTTPLHLLTSYRCRKRFPPLGLMLNLLLASMMQMLLISSQMSAASLMPVSSHRPVSLTQILLFEAAPLTPAFSMQLQLLVALRMPAASHMPVSLTQILLFEAAPLTPAFLMQLQLLIILPRTSAVSHMPVSLTPITLLKTVPLAPARIQPFFSRHLRLQRILCLWQWLSMREAFEQCSETTQIEPSLIPYATSLPMASELATKDPKRECTEQIMPPPHQIKRQYPPIFKMKSMRVACAS